MLLSPAISPQTWWQTDRHTDRHTDKPSGRVKNIIPFFKGIMKNGQIKKNRVKNRTILYTMKAWHTWYFYAKWDFYTTIRMAYIPGISLLTEILYRDGTHFSGFLMRKVWRKPDGMLAADAGHSGKLYAISLTNWRSFSEKGKKLSGHLRKKPHRSILYWA